MAAKRYGDTIIILLVSTSKLCSFQGVYSRRAQNPKHNQLKYWVIFNETLILLSHKIQGTFFLDLGLHGDLLAKNAQDTALSPLSGIFVVKYIFSLC